LLLSYLAQPGYLSVILHCTSSRCHVRLNQTSSNPSIPFLLLSPLVYQVVTYWTVENFYQAMKTAKDDLVMRRKIAAANPYAAKRLGRRVKLRAEWPQIRLAVMEYALQYKFAPGTTYHRRLMATGDQIVEWNNWSDSYWGE
jgi:predicted NAD-dependent protein-ADP-ribosyltransferase YbiA (DUF1768 family)